MTHKQVISELKVELRHRRKTYPKFINTYIMDRVVAEHKIKAMEMAIKIIEKEDLETQLKIEL